MYDSRDIITFIEEEDVKFIRLSFFDLYGIQKNISIMPSELKRAFSEGISFDASAIAGFEDEVHSDLFLVPDPSTAAILPWRPINGRVMRMYCNIFYPDGTPYEKDCRRILSKAVEYASSKGFSINFGPEVEFYLFQTAEDGTPTKKPLDNAGYMDISPDDKGENIRREICFTLEDMGIQPESSHHEDAPGQNEIDFRYSDALTAADNTATFKWVVRTIANVNGASADFSPKPLSEESGNGMHINMSVSNTDGVDYSDLFMAGILEHASEMTIFLNPVSQSYKRLGENKAPRYIVWSPQNRSQLIRIPAERDGIKRIELRSPDPQANPYLAFALLIYAGLDGIEKKLPVPEPLNVNMYKADKTITSHLNSLPLSLSDARRVAEESSFIQKVLPESFLDSFLALSR